jgi:anti-sigma factor (TIGR02949 family)
MLSGSEALSTISCEEVLIEIEHFLHGELDPERSAVLADHLVTCLPCFDRAEFQRKLKEIVRTKCRSDAPEHLVWKVRMAIRTEQTIHGTEDPG